MTARHFVDTVARSLVAPCTRRQALKGLAAAIAGGFAVGTAADGSRAADAKGVVDYAAVYGELSLLMDEQGHQQYFPFELFLLADALGPYLPPGLVFPEGWQGSVVGRWVTPGSGDRFSSDTVLRIDVFDTSSPAKEWTKTLAAAVAAGGEPEPAAADQIGGGFTVYSGATPVASGPDVPAYTFDAVGRIGSGVVHCSHRVDETDVGAASALRASPGESAPTKFLVLSVKKIKSVMKKKSNQPMSAVLYVPLGAVALDMTVDRYGGMFFAASGADGAVTDLRRRFAGDAQVHWSASNSAALGDGTFIGLDQNYWEFTGNAAAAQAQAHFDRLPAVVAEFDAANDGVRLFIDPSDPFAPTAGELRANQIRADVFAIPDGDQAVLGTELALRYGATIVTFAATDYVPMNAARDPSELKSQIKKRCRKHRFYGRLPLSAGPAPLLRDQDAAGSKALPIGYGPYPNHELDLCQFALK